MNSFRQALLSGIFLWICCSGNTVQAQQDYIPGVTDITTVTAVSPLSPTESARFLTKNCQDSTYFIKQVHNQLGGVEYRNDLKAYVISSGDPTVIYTPDVMVCSQWTGIVCNWLEVSKWNGKSVRFDGRYFRPNGVMPKYGGEHIFYLHLQAIK